MLFRSWFGGIVASLGCSAVALTNAANTQAPEPAAERAPAVAADSGAQAAKIAKLIEQLDSPAVAQREKAERDLIALGPAALEALPQPDGRTSAEVAERLARVRQKLEIAYAEGAGRASLITLAGNFTPSELIRQLARQSSNALVDTRGPAAIAADKPIAVKFAKTPFWQALDFVLDAARLDVAAQSKGGKTSLAVSPRKAESPPRSKRAFYRGPFRFAVDSTTVQRGEANVSGVLRVRLEIAWEPRIHPIALSQNARDLTATLASGTKLAAVTPTAQWTTSSVDGDTKVDFDFPFVLPKGENGELQSIAGRFSMLLPGTEATFQFDKLASITRPVSLRQADATVRLESFRRQGDLWEARVRVTYNDPRDAVQSHHGWLYQRRAKLVRIDPATKKETVVEAKNFESDGAEDGVQATYRFALPAEKAVEGGIPAKAADPLANYTFVYTTPAVILSVPVEFAIREAAAK
jgi:hypothetical protein